MPGPPPKPYLLKVAQGNPGHQKLNPGPEFTPGIPGPPRSLKGAGRKLWKDLAPRLHAQGLMAQEFGMELEGLCFSYGRAIEAERILKQKGLVIETKNGYPVPRPEVAIAQKAWQAVNSFCSKFGLSPADQGRIVVPNLKKKTLRESLDEPDSVQSQGR